MNQNTIINRKIFKDSNSEYFKKIPRGNLIQLYEKNQYLDIDYSIFNPINPIKINLNSKNNSNWLVILFSNAEISISFKEIPALILTYFSKGIHTIS